MKTTLFGFFRTMVLLTMFTALFPAAHAAAYPPSMNNPLPEMLKKVVPGVVNISTRTRIRYEENPLFRDPFFRQFFDIPNMPMEREQQSLGSGVIIDAGKGYVITNNHVIDKADKITVTLQDGQNLEAKLIGSDPTTDIALIQIKSSNLVELPKGNSDVLQVGDFVVAIGSPFGLGQTVTSGIVSALGRTSLGIEGYEDFIQTDASINPGNSGGALVNLQGELIGINTAIVGPSGGNVGIGFAIPINLANQVVNQILRFGKIQRGQLGIQIQDLTPALANAFNIKQQRGAVIAGVIPGSSADQAGLQRGDVVVAVNGQTVESATKLHNHIALMQVGDMVTLNVLRDGDEKTVRARIARPLPVRRVQPY
ncbi:MAG: Do family serine endopeptidase [Gammaproteobacteria bacterium]